MNILRNNLKLIITLLILLISITSITFIIFHYYNKSGETFEKSKVILSQMTDEECIKFVKKNGIKIPKEFEKRDDLGKMIKEIIAHSETYPDIPEAVSYTVLFNFSEEIRFAVKKYYSK